MISTIAMPGMHGVQSVFKNLELLGISKNHDISTLNLNELNNIVFFGSWYEAYLPFIRYAKNSGKKVGILWTSSPSETELQLAEIPYIQKVLTLLQRGEIDYIWFLNKDYATIYSDSKGVFYAPPPLPERKKRENIPENKTISIFLPNTLKKNIYAQYLAATYAQKIDNNIKIQSNCINAGNVNNVGWLSPEQYEKALNETCLGLHVSHAESFGYGAYEYFARGIPCLISPTVANHMDFDFDVEILDMVVRNPDSVLETAKSVLYYINIDAEKYMEISDNLYNRMVRLRQYNNKEVIKQLNEF